MRPLALLLYSYALTHTHSHSHAQTKKTLQLFLRALPADSRFNIISFGSRTTSFEPRSVTYDNDSMRRATKHVQDMSANLGGTEIMTPLRQVFETKSLLKYPRQVFVLTDGQGMSP